MPNRAMCKQLLPPGSTREFDPERYWEERHQTFRDSLAAVAHVRLTEQQNAEQYEVKRSHILEMIRRFVPQTAGRLLLDAGCGIGHLTETFAALGFDVVGVDIAPTAIARAEASGIQAHFMVSPLATLDLQRQFDVITTVDVLLHIVDQDQWFATLTSLKRHLKPDGVLIVLDSLDGQTRYVQPHLHPRSREEYVEALARTGLRIIEHRRFRLDHEGSTKDLLAIRHAPDAAVGLPG